MNKIEDSLAEAYERILEATVKRELELLMQDEVKARKTKNADDHEAVVSRLDRIGTLTTNREAVKYYFENLEKDE